MASHKSNCLVGKRLLFLCLARDCAQTIGFFFRYMESLEDLGLYCSAIIGENGSSDGTPNLILQQNNRNVRLLDTSFMGNIGNRLKRLALGRQALLEAASGSGWDEDYVCIVDLDNVMRRPPSLAALQSAMMNLQSDSKIFAIGATSFPVYYDLLSLRAEGYEFLATLDAEIAEAKKHPFKYFQFHREKIYKIQWRMTRPERILCDSSFNGFCIYNSVDFYKGTYRAANETEVCEHVTLNLTMGNATGKQMLISPELVIEAPADHRPVGLIRFWLDRIIKRLSRIHLPVRQTRLSP